MLFSYGVHPVHEPDHPEDWRGFARGLLQSYGTEERLVVLTEGPSTKHPEANHRMEIIEL
jgi:pyruvate kinase